MKAVNSTEIRERISKLRAWMRDNDVKVCIVPQADPHCSEYVEEYYKTRSYFSGFDGSAGTLSVAMDSAGLWTDSRYFIQADIQLKNTGIDLYKEGLASTIPMKEWIKDKAGDGVVAANADCFPRNAWLELSDGINLKDLPDFENIWTDRPQKCMSSAYIHEVKYSGKTIDDKISDVQNEMHKFGADLLIVSNLDDIAWLLNLRADDVKNNPVLRSYVVLDSGCSLFVDEQKISKEVGDYLHTHGIKTYPYDAIHNVLQEKSKKLANGNGNSGKVACELNRVAQSVFVDICENCTIIDTPYIVSKLRAVKNATEIEGYRRAMEKDGVVWIKFLRWFYDCKTRGLRFTEIDVSDKLRELKSQQPLFVDESFGTIAGYAEHGAIGHYTANEESNAVIADKSLLVIDSGTHYLDGTTDITRTLCCGELTDEEKTDYTLVLKGHIALASVIFPKGTKGCQLDILARQFLWQNHMDYGHGTGHGVGHLLNVHEGYAWLRPRENGVVYEAGLTMTDEPGIYKEGKHGIRIENTVIVANDLKNDFGQFLKFETLTLCPIDLTPVKLELLTKEEKLWINNYHTNVYNRLYPLLDADDKSWFNKFMQELDSKLK